MERTTEDELCKLSDELVASRDKILTKFMNYKKDWELFTIQTKNEENEMRINDKYQHVYTYDADTDEIRRIVHCKWLLTYVRLLTNSFIFVSLS